MTGSNRRHSRCKRDALPTELIALPCSLRGKCQRRYPFRPHAVKSFRYRKVDFARIQTSLLPGCLRQQFLTFAKPADNQCRAMLRQRDKDAPPIIGIGLPLQQAALGQLANPA